ncbi:MAG: protein kinase [Acidimicrobiia bacterium]
MSSPATPPTGSPDLDERGPAAATGTGGGLLLAGRYRLHRRLAAGGMAEVWRATDEVLRREVAVKVLHPHLAADATFVARFRQEAVAAARLAHPGIVSIYDTCSEGLVEAIVMELLPGRTLRDRLDEPAPIDPWQAAGLTAQVADALDAAHRAGLVHRDIKPANILLADDGRVKVADFGIAKATAQTDLTQPGAMVGTAKYLAPEQVTGEPIDGRTDLYGLGVVLYEMLCGRPPFTGETDAAVALARLRRDPLWPRQVRPGVPRQLEDVVRRAMARDPDQRYPDAAALRAALVACGADTEAEPDATLAGPAPSRPAPPPPPQARPTVRQTERSWLVPTLLLVLVAVSLAVAGILLGRSGAGELIGGVRDALDGGGSNSGSSPTPTGLTATATAFDPEGDGHEHDDEAPLAVDGDPATAWTTENYQARDITRLKPGVGLVLDLDRVTDLTALQLRSPTQGWKVHVYLADEPADTLEGWGEPVFRSAEIPATTDAPAEVDLGGHRAGAVLVWIVDAGEPVGGRHQVKVQEAQVLGLR